MATLRRLTALALARALLAGRRSAPGLLARLRACLGTERGPPPPWQTTLAERCARLPGEQWLRLEPRALATWIEADPGYQAAWGPGPDGQMPEPPRARRYLLRPGGRMQALPLGLLHCVLPAWPDTATLAQGLGLSAGGLWRLTRPAPWQRAGGLGQQHYGYQLHPKRQGGWRLLEAPAPYLAALQRRVLEAVLDAVPPHEAACGYARGRSVLDHVRAHTGQAVVLRFDLQDFFNAVPAARVHALFHTLGYPETVAQGLTALCTTATPEPVLQRLHEAGGQTWQQRQRLREPHLPQGAPSSPALANLCAFGLDLRLQGLAATLGARYTRYADDLVLSGGPALAGARARIEAWVGCIALEEGFVLQHRKTRCLRQARRQTVCGVVVNRHPNLPREEFDRLKALLHQCVLRGPASQNHQGHTHWRAHLHGRVAWAAQLNPDKAQRLQRLLARIDWAS